MLFQEHIFPFRDQSPSTTADMDDSSFLWPHSDTAHDIDSDSVPVVTHPMSSQSHSSVDTLNSLQVSDSLPYDLSVPSPHCSTNEHVLHSVENVVHDHRPRAETPPLRRSTRTKVMSTWLKDFVQLQKSTAQPAPSSPSQSLSLHSAAYYPLLRPADF